MVKLYTLIKNIYKGDNLVKLTELRYLPRWVVVAMDILLCIAAVYFSFQIIEKLNVQSPHFFRAEFQYLVIIGINIFFMFVFRTFAGVVRHSTFYDLFKLLLAQVVTTVVLIIFNYLVLFFLKSKIFLTPLLLVYLLISSVFLFIFRMVVKQMFHFFLDYKKSSSKDRILVVGVGEESVAVARAIISNSNAPYSLSGFVTNRTDSRRANLLGKKIYQKSDLENKKNIVSQIEGILLVKEIMSRKELEEWTNLALENELLVLKATGVQQMNDQDITSNIKALQIEDLLNRKPISIENSEVKVRHYKKNILITGGAGSIGSEIVRQVARFEPNLIVVLDQAETPLYEIELEVKEKYPNCNFKFILADISNNSRMERIFEEFNFSMVYHAAAYKHVPLIEENPHEAILVNIYGTKNIAQLASKYKVNRFVMISTDKAVNPTNVMGASKRAAELYVQSLQNAGENSTKFITTRFGNVLGSNGSVIPHFKKQIERGGPVTITHPEIVRYFMTIPEACDLVLQAGTMGQGGEIYVFDMGEPVKILDLANRMIKLCGLVPNEDIKIIFTGLRPGEKLYEELLSDGARTMPTHHQKIMISKDLGKSFNEMSDLTIQITKAAMRRDKMDVVDKLKKIVPEFISNNSEFEILDGK